MSVSSPVTRLAYVISALPMTLPTFEFDVQEDLVLYDGGTANTGTSPPITLTLGSDYTVSGGGYNASNQLQTGNVVLVSGGAGNVQIGDVITILRNIDPLQTTTFASTGLQTPLMIEADDDKNTTLAQQLLDAQARGLQIQPNENLSTVLPLTLRKSSVFGFDANGAPMFYPSTASGIGSNTLIVADGSTTGRTLGARFAERVNVKDFGAKGDGVTDDYAAIQAALTAASSRSNAMVYFPAATYRVSHGLLLLGVCVSMCGDGVMASSIVGDLAVSPILTVGSSGSISESPGITSLNIYRAAGTVPTNSIGVQWTYYQYGYMRDCRIFGSYINVQSHRPTADISIGLLFDNCRFAGAIYAEVELENIAGAVFTDCSLNENGLSGTRPTYLLSLKGLVNDVRAKTCQFFTTEGTGACTAIFFDAISALSGGYFTFIDINSENITSLLGSNAGTASIVELTISDSRFSVSGKLFDLNAATTFNSFAFTQNAASAASGGISVTNAARFDMSDNNLSGLVTITGGEAIFADNYCTSNVLFTGVFKALALGGNACVFNNSNPIFISLAGASGNITACGNINDNNAQPQLSAFLPALNLTVALGNYANNAAAIAAGLTTGQVYRNGDVLQIVH